VTRLAHSYRDRQALAGVSVRLEPGVTALVGVNGAGKSTLLNAMAGVLRPASGRVEVGGIDVYGRRRRVAMAQVALMPQLATFPRSMTSLEVVTHVSWMRGGSASAARQRALAALDRVGLADRSTAPMKSLSGGMSRRVALAQAIVNEPDVLLLDEPSTGLDPVQRRAMVAMIGELDGCVVLSSHVMEDVSDVADRVVVLHEGTVRFDGSVDELRSLAPSGTEASRSAEAGFLATVAAFR
jgi:ABC-2 type transport system ATP-binding protein